MSIIHTRGILIRRSGFSTMLYCVRSSIVQVYKEKGIKATPGPKLGTDSVDSVGCVPKGVGR